MLIKTGKAKILGFDIENMPLTYYAPDYPTAKITAIAMYFKGESRKKMHVCILDPIGNTGCSYIGMAAHFVERYNEATLVTGHYVRQHDLPHINAMMFEVGLPPLEPKMVSDTKEDLVKWKGLPKNQEYLIAQLEVKTPKYHMTQYDWRSANIFTPEGLEKTKKRVSSDVFGQLQMREELIEGGYLKEPRLWTP